VCDDFRSHVFPSCKLAADLLGTFLEDCPVNCKAFNALLGPANSYPLQLSNAYLYNADPCMQGKILHFYQHYHKEAIILYKKDGEEANGGTGAVPVTRTTPTATATATTALAAPAAIAVTIDGTPATAPNISAGASKRPLRPTSNTVNAHITPAVDAQVVKKGEENTPPPKRRTAVAKSKYDTGASDAEIFAAVGTIEGDSTDATLQRDPPHQKQHLSVTATTSAISTATAKEEDVEGASYIDEEEEEDEGCIPENYYHDPKLDVEEEDDASPPAAAPLAPAAIGNSAPRSSTKKICTQCTERPASKRNRREGFFLCTKCLQRTFPEMKFGRENSKEFITMKSLLSILPPELAEPVLDERIGDGCSKRPDALWNLVDFAIILEFDEHQHPASMYPDEAGRLKTIYEALKSIPMEVLRLNGDEYTDADGTWHPSCFAKDKHGNCYVKHRQDFINRVWTVRNHLVELEKRLSKDAAKQNLEPGLKPSVHFFYNECTAPEMNVVLDEEADFLAVESKMFRVLDFDQLVKDAISNPLPKPLKPRPCVKWTEVQHECFEQAVILTGGAFSTAATAVFQEMGEGSEGLTVQQVHSHLNYFRINLRAEAEKLPFRNEVEEALQQAIRDLGGLETAAVVLEQVKVNFPQLSLNHVDCFLNQRKKEVGLISRAVPIEWSATQQECFEQAVILTGGAFSTAATAVFQEMGEGSKGLTVQQVHGHLNNFRIKLREAAAKLPFTNEVKDALQQAIRDLGGLETATAVAILEQVKAKFPQLTLNHVDCFLYQRKKDAGLISRAEPIEWTEVLHECFEQAVVATGDAFSTASKAVFEAMGQGSDGPTREQVNSHLLHFRIKLIGEVEELLLCSKGLEDALQQAIRDLGGLENATAVAILEQLKADFPQLTLNHVDCFLYQRKKDAGLISRAEPIEWTEVLHECFEQAVISTGGAFSTAATAVFEAMGQGSEGPTREQVHGHLNNFRINLRAEAEKLHSKELEDALQQAIRDLGGLENATTVAIFEQMKADFPQLTLNHVDCFLHQFRKEAGTRKNAGTGTSRKTDVEDLVRFCVELKRTQGEKGINLTAGQAMTKVYQSADLIKGRPFNISSLTKGVAALYNLEWKQIATAEDPGFHRNAVEPAPTILQAPQANTATFPPLQLPGLLQGPPGLQPPVSRAWGPPLPFNAAVAGRPPPQPAFRAPTGAVQIIGLQPQQQQRSLGYPVPPVPMLGAYALHPWPMPPHLQPPFAQFNQQMGLPRPIAPTVPPGTGAATALLDTQHGTQLPVQGAWGPPQPRPPFNAVVMGRPPLPQPMPALRVPPGAVQMAGMHYQQHHQRLPYAMPPQPMLGAYAPPHQVNPQFGLPGPVTGGAQAMSIQNTLHIQSAAINLGRDNFAAMLAEAQRSQQQQRQQR
jgi:SHAQKYF class myb-like DNA-binding protein